MTCKIQKRSRLRRLWRLWRFLESRFARRTEVEIAKERPSLFGIDFRSHILRRDSPGMDLALLHVATALRPGEAFGLRWQDIDWQKGQISIRRGWSKGKETRGKTKRSMTEVAMHPVLAHALDELGIRLESDDMPKRFLASRRTGFYLFVAREGEVAAGDEITLLSREQDSVSISEILRLLIAKDLAVNDVLLVRRALTQNALPDSWKQYFHEKVSRSALA